MNDILKPFKEYFTMNKNGEYSHLKRTMLTVFHVRFVFVLFETLGFCKSVRVVFPDLYILPIMMEEVLVQSIHLLDLKNGIDGLEKISRKRNIRL